MGYIDIVEKLEKLILHSLNPVFVIGKAGMGKTAVIESIAKKNNKKFFDLRGSMIDSSEVIGIPFHEKHSSGIEVLKYALPEWVIECSEQPSIVLLSEFDRSHISVQNAFLQILNEKRLNNYKFPSHVTFVADGNGINDMVGIEELSLACRNRFTFFEYEISFDCWWAYYGFFNVTQPILSFLETHQDYFYYKSENDDLAYATPRSWTNLSLFITNTLPKGFTNDELINLVVAYGYGFVGSAVQAFLNYLNEKVRISLNDIFNNYEKNEQTIKNLSRSKNSSLINELKRYDINKLEENQLQSLIKFLANIDADERMSYIVTSINGGKYSNKDSIVDKNCKTIFNYFAKEVIKYKSEK